MSWEIVHIDLNKDIPALSSDHNLHVVFWWRHIPLAHTEVLAAQLPMPTTQVMALAAKVITPTVGAYLLQQNLQEDVPINFDALVGLTHPLTKLELSNTKPNNKTVSIVICTRNRPEQLARCLQSLQNLSQQPHEIIVVDNAPVDDATMQVAKIAGVKYVKEPRPGLSIARNTGIRYSTGEIIAFTDDDVVVHPDWIIRLQQAFDDPKVMSVTGLVLPGELETEAQVMFEKHLGYFNFGYQPKTYDSEFYQFTKIFGAPVWRIGAGANMAILRQAVSLVGEFDERLGAGAAGCSEDSEFWYRLLAVGWKCRYYPASVVYHYHRGSVDSLKQQMFNYMRGHVAALLVQFEKHKDKGNLRRLFKTMPKWYIKSIIKGNKYKYNTLFVEIFGCFSGVFYYILNYKSSQPPLIRGAKNRIFFPLIKGG
jgi:GT2 family glycosyltransferase